MRFQILHDIPGRIRLRADTRSMSTEQADILEAWIKTLPGVDRVTVHERTRSVTVVYHGDRRKLCGSLAAFTYESAEKSLGPQPSGSRLMNREYKEKLVFLVIRHFARRFLLPVPLWQALSFCRTCPRIIKGVKAAMSGHLTVEVLDGIAIGTSLATGDYTTAGSVNFLLRVGEILDEWTHKKSVDDLARSMSLQVDRVWKLGDDGTPEITPLGSIAPGDRIVVHTGHVLPLDGILERGAVIAREVADVTIETEDIRELVWLKRLSDALMGRIHRNYRFVMGFNGTLIALGALGLITPAASAFLHNSSTILLSMNCLTALLEKESAIMDDNTLSSGRTYR